MDKPQGVFAQTYLLPFAAPLGGGDTPLQDTNDNEDDMAELYTRMVD